MAVKARIFLVDEQPGLATALTALFGQHGEFVLDHFISVGAALEQINKVATPEAIVLGVRTISLEASVEALRDAKFSGPIITVGDDASVEHHQERSVHLHRPIRFGVLVSHLRRLIREHDHSDEALVDIGPFRFSPAEKSLMDADGTSVKLTDKEVAILKALHRAGNRSLSREMLLEEVWGYNAVVATHTLETHIYRLRQKLSPDEGGSPFLVTDDGGYRLNQPD